MYKLSLKILVLTLALAALTASAFAQSQAEQDIADDEARASSAALAKVFADAGYSLTKTGFGSADRVTDPGTMYAFRIEGLLSRTVLDHMTPTNVMNSEGKLVPPAKGFIASFGASGDVQQVNPGDRYYLHAVEQESDGLVFTFLSVNTTELVIKGRSQRSRLRMYIKFQTAKSDKSTLTAAKIHALTDPVFLAADSAESLPTVLTGEGEDDVRKTLGTPDLAVKFNNKIFLTYKGIHITFVDGKVTDVQ